MKISFDGCFFACMMCSVEITDFITIILEMFRIIISKVNKQYDIRNKYECMVINELNSNDVIYSNLKIDVY